MKSRARLKSKLSDGRVAEVLAILHQTAKQRGASTNELDDLRARFIKLEGNSSTSDPETERRLIVLRAHVLVDAHEEPVPHKVVLWIKENWLLGSIIVTLLLLLQAISTFSGFTVKDMLDGNDGLEQQTRPTPSTQQGVSDTSIAVPSEAKQNPTIRPADPIRNSNTDIAPARTEDVDTATVRITTKPSVTNAKAAPNTPAATLPNNGRLQVTCRTEAEGRSGTNYIEDDEVRCYFTVDQPCFTRFLYRFEDGTIVLLAPDRKVTQAEAGRELLIKDPGFKVAPPFGQERLYVFAQDEPFPALTTRPYPNDPGYTQVMDGLPKTLSRTRGLKPLGQRAEDMLDIVTSERRP